MADLIRFGNVATSAPTEIVPTLSAIDAGILFISIAGATILNRRRKHNAREGVPGQWLGDALSCGTIAVLLLIGCQAVWGARFGLGHVAETNGVLIVTSFAYCIVMICVNLIKSCDGEGKVKVKVKAAKQLVPVPPRPALRDDDDSGPSRR